MVLSVENLQGKLDKELSWRKREIVGLRLSARQSADHRGYLYRAGLVLLCAHWEGFLRRSVELYIEYVFSQKHRLRELAPVFVAHSLYSDVRKASSASHPGSEECHVALARRVQLGVDQICGVSTWEVSTEANPGTQVLAKLLSSIGIDSQLKFDAASWGAMRVFIDEQVVRDRNRIAHGEGFPVSREELMDRAVRLTALLERLSSLILASAEGRHYLLADGT